MRCPKCGYISFDHLEQCLKCKKNIKAVSDNLHGTVFNVAAPTFLQLSSRRDEEAENDQAFADNFEADEEFVDEDLEVLVEDESSEEIELEAMVDDRQAKALGESRKPSADSLDSEDGEIEIDLSQFEDPEELEGVPAETQKTQNEPINQSLSLDLPAELDDLSDLAPPSRETQTEKPQAKSVTKKDVADLEMDDLDFDLGLGDLGTGVVSGSDPAKETILALDDIDFSETLTKSRTKPTGKQGGADMDEDLNFDLDLGGLSIHKDL
jgi:hypothetical protein